MLELAALVVFPPLSKLASFPLGFHPWLHQNLPDHVPKAWDSRTLPSLWSLYPPTWAGLGSWSDFREGNLDVVCPRHGSAGNSQLQLCHPPRWHCPLGAAQGRSPTASTKDLLEMHVELTQVLPGLVGAAWCLPAPQPSLRCGWGCAQSGAGGREDHRNTKFLQEMG